MSMIELLNANRSIAMEWVKIVTVTLKGEDYRTQRLLIPGTVSAIPCSANRKERGSHHVRTAWQFTFRVEHEYGLNY